MDKLLDLLLEGDVNSIPKAFSEKNIEQLCLTAMDVMMQEGNLQMVSTPCVVVGDIHGQFHDLRKLITLGGNVPSKNYIFLGDYVDRGHHSLECILLLLSLKVKYPAHVTLLRGNHESRQITQIYGFYEECVRKYKNGANVWRMITETFDYLGLAAMINGRVFCVHGGLSPEILTLDEIRGLNRKVEPYEGAVCHLLWSDPEEQPQKWRPSERGAGVLFNGEAVRDFNKKNRVELIVRSHQLVDKGYNYMFNQQLVTVWSAPNYCYRCGNDASILEFDDQMEQTLHVFKQHELSNEMVHIEDRTADYFL